MRELELEARIPPLRLEMHLRNRRPSALEAKFRVDETTDFLSEHGLSAEKDRAATAAIGGRERENLALKIFRENFEHCGEGEGERGRERGRLTAICWGEFVAQRTLQRQKKFAAKKNPPFLSRSHSSFVFRRSSTTSTFRPFFSFQFFLSEIPQSFSPLFSFSLSLDFPPFAKIRVRVSLRIRPDFDRASDV